MKIFVFSYVYWYFCVLFYYFLPFIFSLVSSYLCFFSKFSSKIFPFFSNHQSNGNIFSYIIYDHVHFLFSFLFRFQIRTPLLFFFLFVFFSSFFIGSMNYATLFNLLFHIYFIFSFHVEGTRRRATKVRQNSPLKCRSLGKFKFSGQKKNEISVLILYLS